MRCVHHGVQPSSEYDEAALSVGSATDHDEDDEMDTDNDGNEGEGNCAGACNAGTDGFSTVKWKRGSRRSKNASKSSKSSKSSNSSYMEPKKKCTKSAVNQDQDRAHRPSTHTTAQVNLNVYIRGVDFDISKHVVKHPIAFKRSLCRVYGDVSQVKLLKRCLRVTCYSERQRELFLATLFNSFESFRGISLFAISMCD